MKNGCISYNTEQLQIHNVKSQPQTAKPQIKIAFKLNRLEKQRHIINTLLQSKHRNAPTAQWS